MPTLPSPEVLRRIVLASHGPANSFVWWLEATRALPVLVAAGLRTRYARVTHRPDRSVSSPSDTSSASLLNRAGGRWSAFPWKRPVHR